jgi:hypothetical protein
MKRTCSLLNNFLLVVAAAETVSLGSSRNKILSDVEKPGIGPTTLENPSGFGGGQFSARDLYAGNQLLFLSGES